MIHIFAFIILLIGSFAQAQNYVPWSSSKLTTTLHAKQMDILDMGPPSRKEQRLCRQLFARLRYGHKNSNVSAGGDVSVQQKWYPDNVQPPEIISLVDRVFKFWQSTGHYTKKKIESLKKLQESLPPIRTHFLEINMGDTVGAIRIFDGSQNVEMGFLPWLRVPGGKEALTPLERKYGIILPLRSLTRSPYILELGMLGNPKAFGKGVDAIFDSVAQWIDTNYNNMNYRTFGELGLIQQRGLMIYGIARPKLAEYYRQFGYEPVLVPGPNGPRPITFPDGMILIAVDGARFIAQHLKGEGLPEVDGLPLSDNHNTVDPVRWSRNKQIDETRSPHHPVGSMGEFWRHWDDLVAFYSREYVRATNNQQKQLMFDELVANLFVLYKEPIYMDSTIPVVFTMKMQVMTQFLNVDYHSGWKQLNNFVIDLDLARRNELPVSDELPEAYRYSHN